MVNKDYEKLYVCGVSNVIKILDLNTLKEISSLTVIKDEANKIVTCMEKLDFTSAILGMANKELRMVPNKQEPRGLLLRFDIRDR